MKWLCEFFLDFLHSSETLPDEREFVMVTEEEQQQETEGVYDTDFAQFEVPLRLLFCLLEDGVDLSVRKRKAPDNDELTVENAAKKIRVDTAVVQEL